MLSPCTAALDAADRGEIVQPEGTDVDLVEREDELQISAGIGNES